MALVLPLSYFFCTKGPGWWKGSSLGLKTWFVYYSLSQQNSCGVSFNYIIVLVSSDALCLYWSWVFFFFCADWLNKPNKPRRAEKANKRWPPLSGCKRGWIRRSRYSLALSDRTFKSWLLKWLPARTGCLGPHGRFSPRAAADVCIMRPAPSCQHVKPRLDLYVSSPALCLSLWPLLTERGCTLRRRR